MEQERHLRVDVVLRRAVRRPRQAGRLQDRAGRPGERPDHPVTAAARSRAFFNVCRHRGAQAVHRGERRGQAGVPMPVPRLDLRPGRQADRRAEPDQDARHRPGRVRPASASRVREWLGYVWVCLADEPPSFEDDRHAATVVDRLGDVESIDHYDIDDLERRPPDRLRRQGELEAHHRELHGVLPLRHHPPGTDRGAARVRRRATPPSTTSATAPSSARTSRASPSTAREGLDQHPRRRPRTRTGATTRSRSSRRCSSTWCPTT